MLRIVQKVCLLLIICLLPMTITGCWNNVDLNERRFVMGIGIDKAPDGQVILSVQVLKTSKSGSSSNDSSSSGIETETITAQGQTTFDAIRNLLTRVDKKLYYGEIQVIIIGEELARQGISDALDWIMRDTEPDRRAQVIIAKGTTAREILNAKGNQEDIPVVEIMSTIRNTEAFPKIHEIQLYELMKIISSKGKNPVVGVVSMPKKNMNTSVENLDFTGAAAFNKDKLVGWLNPEETIGFKFIENKVKSGIINITNPLDTSAKVSIEIKSSSTKKDIRFINGEPVPTIEVKVDESLGTQEGKGNLLSLSEVSKQENETAQLIKSKITDVIKLSQNEYHTDIFGFGEIVHRKNLNYWRHVENWDKVFSTLPVEINVDSKIRISGLIKERIGEGQ